MFQVPSQEKKKVCIYIYKSLYIYDRLYDKDEVQTENLSTQSRLLGSHRNCSLIERLCNLQTFISDLLHTRSVSLHYIPFFSAKRKFRITLLRGLIFNSFLFNNLLISSLFWLLKHNLTCTSFQ